jgi:APA family basic amino acid/polyamine antiporter
VSSKKISLTTAILININIIIGAGVFLNVKPLTEIAGLFGFAGYLLGAILLSPFVYTLGRLAQAHPVAGGLYAYSKEYLSPFLGFISGWSYFIGKTVSAAFLTHAFVSFFQRHISLLEKTPTLLLSSILIFSLIFLNILGANIGGKIQYIFFACKILPFIFTFIFGLTVLQKANLSVIITDARSIISTVPIALYALMGFEITCSIGHLIKNPKKNIFVIILGSFLCVTTIYVLFQSILFGALGTSLIAPGESLTKLGNIVFAYPIIGKSITALVFTSVISGSFGLLTSNSWNLHTLAQHKHLPGSKLLSKISKNNVPFVSLLIEGAIACLLLVISKNQIALQSMSVFGVVFSFLLCALAAYKAVVRKKLAIATIIPIAAIASCFIILFLCFQKMLFAGISVPYILLFSSGILLGLLF